MTRIPFPVGRANAEQHWAPLSPPDNPAKRRGARPPRVSRNPTAHFDSPPARKRAVIRKAGRFSRPGHTRKQFPSISRQSLISVPVSAPAAKHRSPVARPSLGRCPSGAHPAVRATARRPSSLISCSLPPLPEKSGHAPRESFQILSLAWSSSHAVHPPDTDSLPLTQLDLFFGSHLTASSDHWRSEKAHVRTLNRLLRSTFRRTANGRHESSQPIHSAVNMSRDRARRRVPPDRHVTLTRRLIGFHVS